MSKFPQSSKICTLGDSGVRIRLEQTDTGNVWLMFDSNGTRLLIEALQSDRADIAALGFPVEPPKPTVETAEEVEG